ncbi:MAG: hypothetical protein RKR03_09240 [Candidatus Competibacter sp.]|nr:hypothetical protein [Candidatus Competibacter sp.]
MAITLGGVTLPDGLAWSDEFAWTATVQATDYGLTGALIVEESTRQAGRPITLIGQSANNRHTAWLDRTALLALVALLDAPGATHTLTLHDARAFTVAARHGDGAVEARPVPRVGDFIPADPDGWYILQAVRLIEV